MIHFVYDRTNIYTLRVAFWQLLIMLFKLFNRLTLTDFLSEETWEL